MKINFLFDQLRVAIFVLISFVLCCQKLVAQEPLPYDTTYTFSHYKELRAYYEGLPNGKREIVFLGNSITERGSWAELFKNGRIVNRGIGGDVSFGVLNRIREVIDSKPGSVFLMIGINDIGRGVPTIVVANVIQKIIRTIKVKSPGTKVFLQSVLPIKETVMTFDYMKNKSDKIVQLNTALKAIASGENVRFIDLYSRFADEKGQMISKYTVDGIHLTAAGYLLWVKIFKEEKIQL
jgi:lysophospholipase L1-like esterase